MENEYRGEWWLPEKPEEKVAGVLKYNPKTNIPKAILQLDGAFGEKLNGPERYDIVLGYSTSGDLITLNKCFQTTWSISGDRVSGQFVIFNIIIGAHFSKQKDIGFKEIHVQYSYLEEWMGKRLFQFNALREEGEQGFLVKYLRPESVNIETKQYKMEIKYGCRFSLPPFRMPKIETQIFIVVESKDIKPLDEWYSVIIHIRNFLSLAMISTGTMVNPLSISGIMNGSKSVEILGYEEESTVSDVSWQSILFTYEDISKNPEIYFKNWFDKRELLGSVIDLFFSGFYNPRMYLTNIFLNLAQSIETYHRRTKKNHELTESEHNKRLSKIFAVAPVEHKKWLMRKIGEYSNEPTFRKRLRELVEPFCSVLSINNRKRGFFINKVVNTRNFLTHYDLKLEEKAAKGTELVRITQQLRAIMLGWLLLELGFDYKKTQDIVRKYFVEVS